MYDNINYGQQTPCRDNIIIILYFYNCPVAIAYSPTCFVVPQQQNSGRISAQTQG